FGDITFTDGVGNTVKNFSPNEFSFDVGYSRLFGKTISGAIAFRFIRSDLTGGYSNTTESSAGQAFASDISVYYQNGVHLADKTGQMAFGINISNIGSKLSYNQDQKKDFLPMNLRVGGRLTLNMDDYNKISGTLDLNKLLVPTPPIVDSTGAIVEGMNNDVSITKGIFQSFYDAPGGMSEEIKEITYSIGLEYAYSNQFFVRGGYFHESAMKGNRKYYTFGAGLKYNILTLDFAYLVPSSGRNNPLSNTVRFSLIFELESNSVKSRR
ncbi:MAG TPA: type IX secretion system outer membrane channel protein PorV, partial [Williamwhitmania sp.]|nr:type IX secretion system outer membrane channel protein PorV [Williamwhitmania sp.]